MRPFDIGHTMRCKNDMAVIAANGRVFFIIIFTVGCIGVKTVSGYPESSKDERYVSQYIHIHQNSYHLKAFLHK